jgi:hypothetical protein
LAEKGAMPVLGDGIAWRTYSKIPWPTISAGINPDMNFIGVKNAINN